MEVVLWLAFIENYFKLKSVYVGTPKLDADLTAAEKSAPLMSRLPPIIRSATRANVFYHAPFGWYRDTDGSRADQL